MGINHLLDMEIVLVFYLTRIIANIVDAISTVSAGHRRTIFADVVNQLILTLRQFARANKI